MKTRRRTECALAVTVLGLSSFVVAEDTANSHPIKNDTSNGTIGFDPFVLQDTHRKVRDPYENVTHTDVMIWAYLSKPFALVSILCSFAMIREIMVDRRTINRGGKNPIQWMLLSLAIADIIYGVCFVIGSYASGTIGNIGSQVFCTFQGFCLQLAYLASQFSNAALSLCYLWIVHCAWQDADLARAEKWLLSLVWSVSLAMAIYPIPLGLYNPQLDLCYINSDPPNCEGEECEGLRGGDYSIHLMIGAAMVLPCFFFNIAVMVILFRSVRKVENTARKYATSFSSQPSRDAAATVSASFQRNSGNTATSTTNHGQASTQLNDTTHHTTSIKSSVSRNKSQAVAKQGIAYLLAFLATFSWALIWVVKTEVAGTDWTIGVLEVLMLTMLPLSGCFRFLVFARPRTEMKTVEGRLLRLLFLQSCISASRKCRGMCHRRPGTETIKAAGVEVALKVDEEMEEVAEEASFGEEGSGETKVTGAATRR